MGERRKKKNFIVRNRVHESWHFRASLCRGAHFEVNLSICAHLQANLSTIYQRAFRSFRNLNRRGVPPLVSAEKVCFSFREAKSPKATDQFKIKDLNMIASFADTIRATGASPLTYLWTPSGCTSLQEFSSASFC